ncbi:MAG: translation initiation factor IF-5A [Candidatus Aenigmarchaeota archaeon]|nr:translation initiation factor IF-5A [Candidatus Aenigmarchaeota archaeon]
MAEKMVEIKSCKPGSYIIIDGEACKVTSMVKSKPGKHGAAKVRLDAIGIFDNRKRSLMKPAAATVEVPVIEKQKAQVISVSGDIVQLMDLQTYETFECSIPEEFKDKIKSGSEGTEVIYWMIGKKKQIKEVR